MCNGSRQKHISLSLTVPPRGQQGLCFTESLRDLRWWSASHFPYLASEEAQVGTIQLEGKRPREWGDHRPGLEMAPITSSHSTGQHLVSQPFQATGEAEQCTFALSPGGREAWVLMDSQQSLLWQTIMAVIKSGTLGRKTRSLSLAHLARRLAFSLEAWPYPLLPRMTEQGIRSSRAMYGVYFFGSSVSFLWLCF